MQPIIMSALVRVDDTIGSIAGHRVQRKTLARTFMAAQPITKNLQARKNDPI